MAANHVCARSNRVSVSMWDNWVYLLSDIVRYGFLLRSHILDIMSGRRTFLPPPEPGVRYKHTKGVKLKWYFFLTVLHGSYRCYYCGLMFNKYLMPTIDHRVPFVKGGSDTFDNCVMACKWCNQRKSEELEYSVELAQQRAHNRYYYSRRKKYQRLKAGG